MPSVAAVESALVRIQRPKGRQLRFLQKHYDARARGLNAEKLAKAADNVTRVEGFKIGSNERELRATFGPPNVERPVNTSDLCTKGPANVRVLEYHAPKGFVRRILGTSSGLIAYVCVDATGRITKIYSADIN